MLPFRQWLASDQLWRRVANVVVLADVGRILQAFNLRQLVAPPHATPQRQQPRPDELGPILGHVVRVAARLPRARAQGVPGRPEL